jgi:hypothetical protein
MSLIDWLIKGKRNENPDREQSNIKRRPASSSNRRNWLCGGWLAGRSVHQHIRRATPQCRMCQVF